MKSKKETILLIMLLLLFLISVVSAIDLEIEKTSPTPTLIKELDSQVEYELIIKNNGAADDFNIYSLVGVTLHPKETFHLAGKSTKTIELVAIPSDELIKSINGYLTFSYKIKGATTGIQEESLSMKIIHMRDAFVVGAENLNPDSDKIRVFIYNKENMEMGEVKAVFSSAFFDEFKTFDLGPEEKYEFEISLDREKMKKLFAGGYPIIVEFEALGVQDKIEGSIRFLEKPGLSSSQIKSGLIIKKLIIEKENIGNIPVTAEVNTTKDIITRLFTTMMPSPTTSQRKGFSVYYEWRKDLDPGESLNVDITTSYVFPLILIALILIIIFIVRFYTSGPLDLKKKVRFVRTKGGEFALKVSVVAKANSFIEKISVIDRLPGLVKVHEKFPGIRPDKVDEKNKRITWEIPELQKGEHRILSYIIYSKLGVVGKFELPSASAVYEKSGKVKESSSNKAFFVNEPREKEPED